MNVVAGVKIPTEWGVRAVRVSNIKRLGVKEGASISHKTFGQCRLFAYRSMNFKIMYAFCVLKIHSLFCAIL